MDHVLQLALFAGMVCAIAGGGLAVAPGFQPERKGFGRRFAFFFVRYCVPAWVVMEILVWLLTGRPYP